MGPALNQDSSDQAKLRSLLRQSGGGIMNLVRKDLGSNIVTVVEIGVNHDCNFDKAFEIL